MKKQPNRIFICHAKEDQAKAFEIYDRLKQAGYRPWMEKKDLLPGQKWKIEIPRALKSARFVVILFSKHSFKTGYVQREFKLALDTLTEMPEGKLFIIPGRLEDCEIPEAFADIHYCDLFEEEGFDLVLRTIRSQLDEAPSRGAAGDQSPEKIGLSLKEHREFQELREQIEAQQKQLEALTGERQKQVESKKASRSSQEVEELREQLAAREKELAALKKAHKKPAAQPEPVPAPNKSKMPPTFRSTAMASLSDEAVQQMLKKFHFYDSYENKSGKGFANTYERNGEVVIDRASGLIWQQSGSQEYMNYAKSQEYIKKLNDQGFAGYKDWRLPTLEEGMSLMEPQKQSNDLYIDPVFDGKQRWIWTADRHSAERAWNVLFYDGNCSHFLVGSYGYVRAVRSGH